MTDAGEIVRRFFERMEARDWDGASACLAADVNIEFTHSGEVFEGANFLAMNRAYPDGWTIDVVEIVGTGERVATQVRVDQAPETFWCAGFYTVRNGVIVEGVEHWVTAGSDAPPAWRDRFAS